MVFFPKFSVFRGREASRLKKLFGVERPVSRKLFGARGREASRLKKNFGAFPYRENFRRRGQHGPRKVSFEGDFWRQRHRTSRFEKNFGATERPVSKKNGATGRGTSRLKKVFNCVGPSEDGKFSLKSRAIF